MSTSHFAVVIVNVIALGAICFTGQTAGAGDGSPVKVPTIVGEYINVYQPAGDIFPGPSTKQLVAGRYYGEWVPNDHCFIQDETGRWHAFGITHPRTDLRRVHEGEHQSFHAIAPEGTLKSTLRKGSWTDLPKILPPGERPGEKEQNHAPYIIRRQGVYEMVYGPTPLRYAVSKDLLNWTPKGPLGNTPDGRDPNILFWNDTYYLTVCGGNQVTTTTSSDFRNWGEHTHILTMKEGIAPESPSLIRHNDTFYLFVCGWNGRWDRKELQGAYQHVTYVYQSDNPLEFDSDSEVTSISAHAPEIFRDEDGDWYISSVEWPSCGVSIARLAWE